MNPSREHERREMPKRWRVFITRKSSKDNGTITELPIYVDEIEELQEIVEKGPDWRSLIRIEIIYNLGRP